MDGFRCKPKHVDLDRPMLHYRHHLLLCEGQRCAKAGSKNLAHDLRGVLKAMGLASGRQRIKISRTMCVGACRNRATLVIYERGPDGMYSVNNGQWLRHVEDLSELQWRALFRALADNARITQVIDACYFAVVEDDQTVTSLMRRVAC
ncbi:(2Fe-2S) ferredoxin domain-containing protein [Vibrio sp. PP-XX7]